MTDSSRPVPGPLSRPIVVADIPPGGMDVTVEASEAERQALAADFKLPAIAELVGRFDVRPTARGARVEGRVAARVTQICIVTLEPFEATVDEPVEVEFGPAEEAEGGQEMSPLFDPPDPIVDGRIDLGALTAEFLSLSLDPYPRKPGVAFAEHAEEVPPGSPFAALASLRAKTQKGE